jgi:ATP-binding cassette, subfamily C (CFTR/MRP), member 1
MITTSIVSAMVSIRRLSKFLKADELQDAAVIYEDQINALPVLEIKDGDFRWSKDSVQASLDNINLKVGSGDLVAVLGRVGSGKVSNGSNNSRKRLADLWDQSSLLSAIAGEMYKSDGTVTVRGTVAYCPQNPWCDYHSSIRL